MMPSRGFIARTKSMPGFKASKDRVTHLFRANAAGDLRLKPVLIYHSENPRALKNYVKPTLPGLSQWNNKAWMTAHLFTAWFTAKLAVETYCSGKKKKKRLLSKYYCSSTMHLVNPAALVETYSTIPVVFMPVNTACMLQPVESRRNFDFRV